MINGCIQRTRHLSERSPLYWCILLDHSIRILNLKKYIHSSELSLNYLLKRSQSSLGSPHIYYCNALYLISTHI